MALAMQKAMEFLPSHGHVVAQLASQTWWRDGVMFITMYHLADQTWELKVLYGKRMYAVVYDALDGRCDAIEPVDVD